MAFSSPCRCTSSPFNSITLPGPWRNGKIPSEGRAHLPIDTSEYDGVACRRRCGLSLFSSPAFLHESAQNKECVGDVLQQTPTLPPPPNESQWEAQRRHAITCQMEQKAWLLVSSLATAHQTENDKWFWTWNIVTVVCSVIHFVVSSAAHPRSIWHAFVSLLFFFSLPLFNIQHTACDIIFHKLPCWHRHKTGAEPRSRETMLPRWKQQEERWRKDQKRKSVCKMCFFFLPFFHGSHPRLFNFIWDYRAWWAQSCCESLHAVFADASPHSDRAPWIPLIAV